jgi:hypothetical protein
VITQHVQTVPVKIDPVYLHARSGNGAVPTGSYTLLVPANPKRRWFVVTCTDADAMLVVLCRELPASGREFSNLYLAQGGSVVLSMTGDMPWQGAIWATGASADSACYWSEIEEYP